MKLIMELKSILSGLEGLKVRGNLDVNVKKIKNNSKTVEENDMFVAIKGFDDDGHKHIKEAIENGAKVILAEEDKIDKNIIKEIPEDIVLILTKDTRYALAIVACNFYKNPSKKMKLIGVTGTKGKTTTTYMIRDILEKHGIKVGLIGTVASYVGDRKIADNENTTPESLKLQEIFSKMLEEKCEAVVMEVSSQSLKLERVAGCDFDIGVFTNFAEDHISSKEHPDMEDYFNSKVKLFKMCKKGFINADDVYSIMLPKLVPECQFTSYGIDNHCDLLAKDITVTNQYADFKVKIGDKNERVKVSIPGRFSVYNSLAAIAVAMQFGCNSEEIKGALENIRVPGRSELVDNKLGLTIMIDYAHTPESLEKILSAVKIYTKGRVISVFGCGGDRDKNKRPMMGEVSGRVADYTIITSDNPRTENPEEIVKDIEEGIKKTNGKYECIVDRKEAIRKAIKMANKRDMIVLAGKGHEQYQEINKKREPFDESEIVNNIIEEMMQYKIFFSTVNKGSLSSNPTEMSEKSLSLNTTKEENICNTKIKYYCCLLWQL